MPKGKIKFSNAKELAELTEEYFNECDREEYAVAEDGTVQMYKGVPVKLKAQTPYSLTEYALHLGMMTKSAFDNYLNGRCSFNGASEDEYAEMMAILKTARARITGYAERRLYDKEGCNGAKFFLASNEKGWSDKSKVENTQKVIVVSLKDEDELEDDDDLDEE